MKKPLPKGFSRFLETGNGLKIENKPVKPVPKPETTKP